MESGGPMGLPPSGSSSSPSAFFPTSAPSHSSTSAAMQSSAGVHEVSLFSPLPKSNVGSVRMDGGKKKRGRPRKYGPDGTAVSSASASASTTTVSTTSAAIMASAGAASQKRARGRPLGSGKNQQLAALGEWLAGSAGVGFTPHVITVAAGEDVATKIMSFSQQGPRSICILSANGAISNVTIRQSASSGGTVSYEGRFEMLSLSGSFLLSESGGTRSRTGGLSVSLAGPDGHVVGGCVAGLLMAASPVQVVVGSFLPNNKKNQAQAATTDPSAHGTTPSLFSGSPPPTQTASKDNPTSKGATDPTYPPVSAHNPTLISFNNSPQQAQHPPSIAIPLQSISWQTIPEARRNTDINNRSLPGG